MQAIRRRICSAHITRVIRKLPRLSSEVAMQKTCRSLQPGQGRGRSLVHRLMHLASMKADAWTDE